MPACSASAEELVELLQALLPQHAGVAVERMVSEEDADAVDAQLLHPREVLARGLGIELLPHLRRPAGAGPVVVHAEGDEGLAGFGLKGAPVFGDPHLGQGLVRRAKRGGEHEQSSKRQKGAVVLAHE